MDPKSRIKSLCDQANTVASDANIPVKRYFRSGLEMLKIAAVYEGERNFESAFVLYMRFITLFVEKISDHPEYKGYQSPDRITIYKKLKIVLRVTEEIKSILLERYKKEHEDLVAQQRLVEKFHADNFQRQKEREQVLKDNKGVDSNTTVNSGINVSVVPLPASAHRDDHTLDNVVYPSTDLISPTSPEGAGFENYSAQHPSSYSEPSIPSRELKPSIPLSVPIIDRGNKPLSLLSDRENLKFDELRPVSVPHDLMGKFLDHAISNTSRNVETCGILAGKMANNKFMISHLVIPKQEGSPDDCKTLHEEEIFEQQDKYDLITLGWIHTHPSQTAFLSSVDLHTHCSYQLMMPEAIAIVCAPKYNETGYFMLTGNHGLHFISNCRESGFHPHPSEPPLFGHADHVIVDSGRNVQVIDLRS